MLDYFVIEALFWPKENLLPLLNLLLAPLMLKFETVLVLVGESSLCSCLIVEVLLSLRIICQESWSSCS